MFEEETSEDSEGSESKNNEKAFTFKNQNNLKNVNNEMKHQKL